jgi:hypothetical protein
VQRVHAGREVQFTAARVPRVVQCRGCVQARERSMYNSRVKAQRGKYGAAMNVQVEKYSVRVHVQERSTMYGCMCRGENYSPRVHVQGREVQYTSGREVINSLNTGGME